jgi:hypothetical protein
MRDAILIPWVVQRQMLGVFQIEQCDRAIPACGELPCQRGLAHLARPEQRHHGKVGEAKTEAIEMR